MRRIGLIVLLSACGPPVPAQAPEPEAEPPQPPVTGQPDATEEPATEPADSQSLPERFAKLGRPCREILRDDGVDPFCDDKDVAVGLGTRVDMVQGVPPAWAQLIHHEPRDDSGNGTELSIAYDGRRLWIHQVTCGNCRRVLGWAFVGVLSELTDAHLAEIQDRAYLPREPPLRSPEAWQAAYED